MTQAKQWLGVDFGTSNSAAGFCVDGRPVIVPLEGNSETLPTALFFDFEERSVEFGKAAAQALYEGAWGRYMRALKSLLGTPLMQESQLFLGKRMSYSQIVARFLSEVKTRAEAQTGRYFTHALSGRPVRFHADPARDARALADLKACYLEAGFDDVDFMNEPEAAARARRHVLSQGDLGLVVDIGGGTSDFTLFRTGPDKTIEILGSEGMRLGGTDFDKSLNLDFAMPHMGRGSQIRHAFGAQTHTAPNGIFADLATWQKIPFLYAPETRRAAADLLKYAVEPDKLQRLLRVLEDERGHDLAFAVEAAKIALNTDKASQTRLDLGALQKGLGVPMHSGDLALTLGPQGEQIADLAEQTLHQNDTDPEDVTHLILVGGSSLMQVIKTSVQARFPRATCHEGGALTGIVEGLAEAAATR